MKISVLSDTHGLLIQEALDQFSDSDAILHGGDINNQRILLRLYVTHPSVDADGIMTKMGV